MDVSVSQSPDQAAQKEYEVADVSVFSGGGAPFRVRPESFEFVSRDGSVHKPLAPDSALKFGAPLPAALLAAGEGAHGIVVFLVPAGGGEVVAANGAGGQLAWAVAS